jgi:hypothetical protein
MIVLKPQDVLVALKAFAHPESGWTLAQLAHELGMSASQVHASVRRATGAGFINAPTQRWGDHYELRRASLIEFLVHGIKYVFVPQQGGIVRGMPTAYAAQPLKEHFQKSSEPPPVWPDPEGVIRGVALEPFYRSVPFAAKKDERLYQCLALVDALRIGRARERKLAAELLTKMSTS